MSDRVTYYQEMNPEQTLHFSSCSLGQFNKLSVRLGFSFFVYPMLVLAYLGQGARLITDGDAVMANIFYSTIPGPVGGPLYW